MGGAQLLSNRIAEDGHWPQKGTNDAKNEGTNLGVEPRISPMDTDKTMQRQLQLNRYWTLMNVNVGSGGNAAFRLTSDL
jgi:hypothetical protein